MSQIIQFSSTNDSISIKKDFNLIEKHFNSNIDIIVNNLKFYKNTMKLFFVKKTNGLSDTIDLCLNNLKNKIF